jgi:hypothetical protein
MGLASWLVLFLSAAALCTAQNVSLLAALGKTLGIWRAWASSVVCLRVRVTLDARDNPFRPPGLADEAKRVRVPAPCLGR